MTVLKRVLRWMPLMVLVVDAVLVVTGVLKRGAGVGVGAGVESLLWLLAVPRLVLAVGAYRRDRTAGLDPWSALEDGLVVLLPRSVARLIALEPQIYAALWRWVFWRRPSRDDEFAYRKRSWLGVVLAMLLFTTPVELLLPELLVPWAWVRWGVALVGVYGVLWIAGLQASLVTLPHRIACDGLRLHYGVLARAHIPYAAITSVALERRKAPGKRDGLYISADDDAAFLQVGGETDVALQLATPYKLRGLRGPTHPVMCIYLAADDAPRFVRTVRQHLDGDGARDCQHPLPKAPAPARVG